MKYYSVTFRTGVDEYSDSHYTSLNSLVIDVSLAVENGFIPFSAKEISESEYDPDKDDYIEPSLDKDFLSDFEVKKCSKTNCQHSVKLGFCPKCDTQAYSH